MSTYDPSQIVVQDFFRAGQPLLIRQAARLLVADTTATKPASCNDFMVMASGTGQFDARAASGWSDLGVTKGGTRVTRGLAEDGEAIENGVSITERYIANVGIETAMANMQLATFSTLWDNPITVVSATENRMGGGSMPQTKLRRLVVSHPIYDPDSKRVMLVRAYVFPLVEVLPNDQQVAFAKSGDAQTLPVTFRALGDPSETNPRQRFFYILEALASQPPNQAY